MPYFQRDSIDKCFIDKETGLNNPTGLFYLLHHFIIQYERYEDNWGFMLLKLFEGGVDRKKMAMALVKHSRRSDILFYLDGDFGVLTRVFSDEDLIHFSHRLSSIFRDEIGDVEVRYGITFMKSGDSPEDFINRAYDAAQRACEGSNTYAIVV